MPQKYTRTDIWREGKWLDLWSIVHLLSGLSLGLGFSFLPVGAFAAIALAFVLLVAYEMWETIVRIEETPTNRFMDVVVGMVGFLPAFFLCAPLLSAAHRIEVFAVMLVVDCVMSFFGWRASQKAAALQKNLRARYVKERARLMKQKTRLEESFKHEE